MFVGLAAPIVALALAIMVGTVLAGWRLLLWACRRVPLLRYALVAVSLFYFVRAFALNAHALHH